MLCISGIASKPFTLHCDRNARSTIPFRPLCDAMMCTAVLPYRSSRPSCFCAVEIFISWSRGAGGFPRHLVRGFPPRPAIVSGLALVGCLDTTSRRLRSAWGAGGRAVWVSRTTPIGGIPRHHCRPAAIQSTCIQALVSSSVMPCLHASHTNVCSLKSRPHILMCAHTQLHTRGVRRNTFSSGGWS